MDSEKLFQWMAENGVKVSEMANKLGIGHNTLSIYKSRGLPEKKKALAQKVIDTWFDAPAQPGITHLPRQGMFDDPIVQISLERNTYTEWQQAGLISENQFTSYAYKKINQFAKKINRKLDELAIEEDATLYPFQVLTSLAAGSGITSDNIDEITINKQYPEACKGARVRGDSMESETGLSIPDKSIAVIDTEWEGKPFAVKNKIYAWATPEGDMIKKFVRRKVNGKTQGFLESLNPSYKPIPYEETMIPQGEFVEVLEK